MKLSQQESAFVNFLLPKREVYWEELVQFCKTPATVKLKTVQKVVSDLKRKYKDSNETVPFNCSIRSMPAVPQIPKMVATYETTKYLGQTLVQIKRPNQDTMLMGSKPSTPQASIIETKQSSTTSVFDFIVKSFTHQILTKSGIYALNNEEFEIFNYFHSNRNKFISLEELRDKVCFPKFGSKLPARWFSSIQRRVSHIRHQIPEARDKILTAKQNNNTGYIFN